MDFEPLRVDKTLIPRIRLKNSKTREINAATIRDLDSYIKTPQIRENLPKQFISSIEGIIEVIIERIELNETLKAPTEKELMREHNSPFGTIFEDEHEDIYEDDIPLEPFIQRVYDLLYNRYPEINRKFNESIRKKKARQDSNKKERSSKSHKKGAETRKLKKAEAEENKAMAVKDPFLPLRCK